LCKVGSCGTKPFNGAECSRNRVLTRASEIHDVVVNFASLIIKKEKLSSTKYCAGELRNKVSGPP
jgi:hypothetical protein